MKNWKIIAWIIFFFPLGLYYMHTYSDWSKKITYSLSGLYGLLVLVSLLTGTLPVLGFLLGLTLFIASFTLLVLDLRHHTSKKHSLVLLTSSVLFMAVTSSNIEFVNPEVRIAAENEQRQLLEEAERLEAEKAKAEAELVAATEAVEKAEIDQTRKSLDNAYELVDELSTDPSELLNRLDVVLEGVLAEELLISFVEELEMAEEAPTRVRLSRLEKKILEIDKLDESLITRLEGVRSDVESDEENISLAEAALDTAETDPTWANHEAASLAIAAIQSSKTSLNHRLTAVENTITANEAEELRKAEEEEEKRAAEAERKAEEERQLQAEADRKAKEEIERKEAEQANAAASNQSSTSSTSSQETPTLSGEQALVNFLNNASHTELQAVSYIGNKRASYIIEYRQNNGAFTHSSQVKNVNQIGDGIYGNLVEMFK